MRTNNIFVIVIPLIALLSFADAVQTRAMLAKANALKNVHTMQHGQPMQPVKLFHFDKNAAFQNQLQQP